MMASVFRVNRNVSFFRKFHTGSFQLHEDHYKHLKLPYDASIADIKNKFKKLSLKLHPDMLKSQGLSEDELSKKSEEYLTVKKSYEILSDEKKKSEYDVKMGFKTRNNTSTNSFLRRTPNTFHFHHHRKEYEKNKVSHFDSEKHQARNERIEKHYNYNKKMNQTVDAFGRDLYARNLGTRGPKKAIYREYKYQPHVRDDEAEGRKVAIKLVSGVVGTFVLLYLLVGNYSTKKTQKKQSDVEKVSAKENTENGIVNDSEAENPVKEEKNSRSKSGKSLTVNNAYGLMILNGSEKEKGKEKEKKAEEDMEVFEEQISETVE